MTQAKTSDISDTSLTIHVEETKCWPEEFYKLPCTLGKFDDYVLSVLIQQRGRWILNKTIPNVSA